jgi:hypothetical protein
MYVAGRTAMLSAERSDLISRSELIPCIELISRIELILIGDTTLTNLYHLKYYKS